MYVTAMAQPSVLNYDVSLQHVLHSRMFRKVMQVRCQAHQTGCLQGFVQLGAGLYVPLRAFLSSCGTLQASAAHPAVAKWQCHQHYAVHKCFDDGRHAKK